MRLSFLTQSDFLIAILLSCLVSSCMPSSGYYLVKRKQGIISDNNTMSGAESHDAAYNGINHFTNKNAQKPILVPEDKFYVNGPGTYSDFIMLCNKRKIAKATKILGTEQTTDSDSIQYLRALTLFLRYRHVESIDKLKTIQAEALQIDVRMLQLDNEYEIQKSEDRIEKKYFITQYQSIFDDKTIPDDYKKIVETRIKYIRYQ